MALSVVFLLVLIVIHAIWGSIALALGVVGVAAWCMIKPSNNRRIRIFLVLVFLIIMMAASALSLSFVSSRCTWKYDLYLHAIDHTLGFCPPQQLMTRLVTSSLAYRITAAVYQFLPFVMVLGYGWAAYHEKHPGRLIAAYVISACSVLLYLIVPASGPVLLLGSGLLAAHPPPEPSLIHLDHAINCIPSVHLSTAICIWFFNRSNTIARRTTAAFAFATAFATLALGQHYLIDLVLSPPFALFVVSAASREYRKAGVSILAVLLWLVAIRLDVHALLSHPVLLWSAAIVTAVIPYCYLLSGSTEEGERAAPLPPEGATVMI